MVDWPAYILVFAVSIAAGLIALEWLARRFIPQKEKLPRGLFRDHPDLGYVFTPGFVGRSNIGIEYRINSLGLRDDEHDYLIPAEGQRILALGNSFAMGAGENYADTFLVKLEDYIRRSEPLVEVVKAGIGGYGTRHELGYFRAYGRQYRADMVMVLFHVGTDFRNNMSPQRGRVRKGRLVPTYPYSNFNRAMKILENHSATYNALLYLLRQDKRIRGMLHKVGLMRCAYPQHVSMYRRFYTSEQRQAVENTLEAIDGIKHLCEDEGSQFLLCVVPDRLQVEDDYFSYYLGCLGEKTVDFDRNKPNELLRAYCDQHSIHLIDLLDDFRRLYETGQRVYLEHDIHWDEAGRAEAARKVGDGVVSVLNSITGHGAKKR
jgi:hypothetical protein